MEKDIFKNEILKVIMSNTSFFWQQDWNEKEIESLKKNFNSLIEAEKSKGKYIIPHINKNKIRNISRKFKINNETLEKIISTIKPLPLEIILTKEPWFLADIKKKVSSKLNSLNQQIKKLSPLVKMLENHQKQSPLPSIPLAIEELKSEIELYREIIKVKQENDKRFNSKNFIISKMKKSPQKHEIWNDIVLRTIEILNPYCHNQNCYFDRKLDCKKTHEKTYKIIANLLKIIYPKIWKGKIDTIAKRIKQKNYRQL